MICSVCYRKSKGLRHEGRTWREGGKEPQELGPPYLTTNGHLTLIIYTAVEELKVAYAWDVDIKGTIQTLK
jgi:hypothetical protein